MQCSTFVRALRRPQPRPGSNTYILNELGVGYRMIEEDAKPLESAEETK